MYEVGDRVLYGSHGICCVVALEERKVDRKKAVYLILEPVGHGGASYLVPAHNAAAMAKLSPMLTRAELDALLTSEEIREPYWVPENNLRKTQYREIINSCDRVKILRMIRGLYRHRDSRLAEGKKFHQSDDIFLRDAEKVIASEIGCVMELELQQAKQYLREQLET